MNLGLTFRHSHLPETRFPNCGLPFSTVLLNDDVCELFSPAALEGQWYVAGVVHDHGVLVENAASVAGTASS
jgi:hypothetical protein